VRVALHRGLAIRCQAAERVSSVTAGSADLSAHHQLNVRRQRRRHRRNLKAPSEERATIATPC
jgi:hypothetical protein